MDRGNHYEAAFAGYLQSHRLCHVAVDETRRAALGESTVKSLDFIVFGDHDARLLVDVKGRRFPTGPAERPRRVWECWSTRDDVEGLERWAAVSGHGYRGLLVFVYDVLADVALPDDTEDLWAWRGRRYLMRAVPSADYRRFMRVRSRKWDTVTLPHAVFRSLVRPLHHFTGRAAVPAEECLV